LAEDPAFPPPNVLVFGDAVGADADSHIDHAEKSYNSIELVLTACCVSKPVSNRSTKLWFGNYGTVP
jgi:hypothetical protein